MAAGDFCGPPPREARAEGARARNAAPLPPVTNRAGLRLPPEAFALLTPNYQVRFSLLSTSISRILMWGESLEMQ